eukprot:TRINITY_DN5994_c0_g1_i1.p1 TRINITY_DN5994_c0_g1~~TRINITY_DN5994_c0_g1_i1.p1  ORF type:complete len:157 (+),score=33.11 TRINITY_DN5994_c0_g1_i1:52-471(+)
MAELHQDLDEADRILRGMGSWWGTIWNYFTPDNTHKNRPKKEKYTGHTKKYAEVQRSLSGITQSQIPSGLKDERAREWWTDTEKDLESMSHRIDTLRQMAKDIGSTVDDHNKDLEDISTSVALSKSRLTNTRRKMWRIA